MTTASRYWVSRRRVLPGVINEPGHRGCPATEAARHRQMTPKNAWSGHGGDDMSSLSMRVSESTPTTSEQLSLYLFI